MTIDLNARFTVEKLHEFAHDIKLLSNKVGFKVSSRGWGYILENAGFITKDEFDKVEKVINRCRREGILPVDFVAEEDARQFSGVETPDEDSVKSHAQWFASAMLKGYNNFTPDWWYDEEYYIQMVVEKIDLKTLFGPVCNKYHVPIANSKGWSSILQRAEYARRFKLMEEKGLQCVLLYCGDHDPDGLRISDTLQDNLAQIQGIVWEDGEEGYDPSNLDIRRFGLNYDFIIENGYPWIDNLITGSGKNLNSPSHPNHSQFYVQDYLSSFGAKKCEANAIVTTPQAARQLAEQAILDVLGPDALDRFGIKSQVVKTRYQEILEESGLQEPLSDLVASEDEPDPFPPY